MDFLNELIPLLLLTCGTTLVALAIFAVFAFTMARQQFNAFIDPDVSQLAASFDRERAQDPNRAIKRLINRQAFRCGLIGALTGFGGFVTLLIALPLDMAVTLRLQTTMVGLIGRAYGFAERDNLEKRMRDSIIMTGSGEITRRMTNTLTRYIITRFVGKSLARFIPLIGAVIAFTVNYAAAQAVGRAAVSWYGNRARQQPSVQA